MANEIKVTSIDDLQQRCSAAWAVYSPSRGKIYDFSGFKREKLEAVSTDHYFSEICC